MNKKEVLIGNKELEVKLKDGLYDHIVKIATILIALIAIISFSLSYSALEYAKESQYAKIDISPSKFNLPQKYPLARLIRGEDESLSLTILNLGGSESGKITLAPSYKHSNIFSPEKTTHIENIYPKESIQKDIYFELDKEVWGEVDLPIRVRCDNCKERETIQDVTICIYRDCEDCHKKDCP